jgi:DnaJ-class molecular chaperone|tara:strand:- start:319 stop:615 length:297 start_codon:yes stop_codon:yes gene_type:complete
MEKNSICPKCEGNGYIKATIEEGRETIILQCVTCNSQGELSSERREIFKLNEKVEELEGKKDFLKGVCKRAGAEIHFLKRQIKDKDPLVLKPEWEVKK